MHKKRTAINSNKSDRKHQTAIWKYDTYATTHISRLPKAVRTPFVILGRMTLPSIWAALVTIVSAAIFYAGYQTWAMTGLIVVLSIPAATIMKLLIRRERPNTIYARSMRITSYSFPSSHTYSATLAGGYLALLGLALFGSQAGLIVAAVLTAAIIIIGISRVYIGAHYPTDVTAGWILGAIALFTITTIIV